jgi:adenylosuccinate lyase
VHFACTSEDINNLAYALMLHDARDQVLLPGARRADRIDARDGAPARRARHAVAHARADGLPHDAREGDGQCRARLERQRSQIAQVTLPGKLNGAVGNYNAHLAAYPELDWPAMARDVITGPRARVQRVHDADRAARRRRELCDAMRRANVILIDLCRDVWGYVSLGYFRQTLKPGEVGSSTMPHKVNPIDFENAEGNLGLANALLGHFSEKLRSRAGSATSAIRPCCARSAPRSAIPRSRSMRSRAGSPSWRRIPSAWRPTWTRAGRCWPKRCRP